MLVPTKWAFAKGLREDRHCFALVGLALLCLLSGCESTRSAQLEREAEMLEQKRAAAKTSELAKIQDAEARVWDVFHPLILEAANYQVSESFGYIGAVFVTERFYPDRLRSTVRQYSIGPYVSISQVFPNTPAEEAGLIPGDRIIALNGKRLPRWDSAARYASMKLKRDLKPEKVNTLLVERAGELFEVKVVPVKAAYHTVIVSPDSHTDIRPDGEVIWLSLDLVDNLSDPTFFAYACAYSLAQSVMQHPEKRRRNLWIGQAMDVAVIATGIPSIGVVGNATSHSKRQSFAVEADLIALYLLAANDYDVSRYPEFWEKQFPRQAYTGALEVQDLRRLEVQQQIIRSIAKKKENGSFIFPEEYLSGDASEVILEQFAGGVKRRNFH